MWADTICINQEDVTERDDQVTIMGTIFRSAETVLAWIGTSSRTTRKVSDVAKIHLRTDLTDLFDDSTDAGSGQRHLANFGIENVESLYAHSMRPYTRPYTRQDSDHPATCSRMSSFCRLWIK